MASIVSTFLQNVTRIDDVLVLEVPAAGQLSDSGVDKQRLRTPTLVDVVAKGGTRLPPIVPKLDLKGMSNGGGGGSR